MTEPATGAPSATATDDDATGTGRGRRWPWALGAVVAVAVAVAVAVGVVELAGQLADGSDALTERDRLAAARRAAADFGGDYLSFDADSVDESSERLADRSTADFAAEFEQTRAPGLGTVFSEPGTTTRASVTEVFLGELDRDRIRALVVADIAATSDGQAQRLEDLSFVLELVREDGRWLVDGVGPAPFPEVVGEGGGQGQEPAAPSTTSTTAPVPSADAPPAAGQPGAEAPAPAP